MDKEYPLYTQSWCWECGASWLGDDERHASYCSVPATRAAAATGATMASERCFCPCHTHPGTYPPPCGVCGHDTRDGHLVGGYRDGWESNKVRADAAEVARLTALLAEADAEVARLRGAGQAYRAALAEFESQRDSDDDVDWGTRMTRAHKRVQDAHDALLAALAAGGRGEG